ncbi:class I SAM-dependent methyltransferase [Halobacillus sp. Nhm2S1]|uniref:class I SAM-dependent DNA methyltransferase n=1 Tax=Halobacillus sp. Nhm2S1 TaxID=2866716 RepID=UPI001C72DC2D|nr:class I SAM-dependent methyltransferase [Halobacillus sp. Nhm2S1]MBX0358787.1 class I SAM-dependent methyltransferase [Halobacillus sp. Nhm2S1]
MSYGDMARVYDLLMQDAPYGQWVNFTKQMLQQYHANGQKILDVGCGTGEITHRLHDEGYQMTGIDLSSDMLTVAQQKNPRAAIEWLQQDMTALEGLSGYDCVISYCDVVNYLTDDQKVQQAFDSIYQTLTQGGVFLFDVHSIDHIHKDLSGATFAEVRDDLSFIWFCDSGELENSLIHDLTFFVEDDGKYQRFDEIHEQRGYDQTVLRSWLSRSGFKVQGVFSDFSEEPSLDGERWLFVCTKE